MLFSVVILSIIEGVTEFLPVSSTGHLILVSDYLDLPESFYHLFDIAIQLGAIMAVVVLKWRDVWGMIRSPLSRNTQGLIMTMIPILILGWVFKSTIKSRLFDPTVIFWGLIVGGVALIITDWVVSKKTRPSTQLVTRRHAMGIGLAQCLALWPGMSRSAVTIMGGIGMGLSRRSAASYSFLIAPPLMVIVVGYDVISSSRMAAVEYGWMGLGMGISFVVAYWTMRWFIDVVDRRGLGIFGVYRIVLGGLGLLFYA